MKMCVYNARVHIAREAEVIGINNQALQIEISTLLDTEPRALASGSFGKCNELAPGH